MGNWSKILICLDMNDALLSISYHYLNKMNPLQKRHYNELKEIASNRGWKVVSEVYISSLEKIKFQCPVGHIRKLTSYSFKEKRNSKSGCAQCSGVSKIEGERNFIKRMTELGCTIIGKYNGSHGPVEAICKNGHRCQTRPGHIQRGEGPCRACVGHDPITAMNEFFFNGRRQRMEGVGTICQLYRCCYDGMSKWSSEKENSK
jgi:hypothetical protein